MTIIDVHAHIYPDAIAQRAADSIGVFYELNMHLSGTVHELLDHGRAAGISRFMVHSAAVTPGRVRSVNDYLISAVQEHADAFIGFGTMHPDYEDVAGELDRIKAAGLKGVKLHPDFQHFCLDDEKAVAMFQAMAERNMPGMIHTGDYRYDYSHPRRLVKILEMFPKLEVIGAHFGGWSLFGEAYELLKNRSCWVDLSSSRQFMSEAEFLKYIDLYGADRVLYGSDFPLWDPKEEAEFFLRLPLAEDAREKIAWKNAEKIMKRC